MSQAPQSRAFSFAGEGFVARSSGALYWPARQMLICADLHLGRTERYARRGGALLPPWHDEDTLARLGAEIAALDPKIVVSLGDGFDDDIAAQNLSLQSRSTLAELAQGRDWLWLSGNHDPAPFRAAPGPSGQAAPDWRETAAPLYLRHMPEAGSDLPQICGHYHPVASLAGRRWRCFALAPNLLILPSFGAFTGGLDVNSPDFRALMPSGIALCCSPSLFALPFPAPLPAQKLRNSARLRRV